MDVDIEAQDTEALPPSVCIFYFTLVLDADFFFFSALPLLKTYLMNCQPYPPLRNPISVMNSTVI
jgi:hypothetical protein